MSSKQTLHNSAAAMNSRQSKRLSGAVNRALTTLRSSSATSSDVVMKAHETSNALVILFASSDWFLTKEPCKVTQKPVSGA